MTQSFGHGLCTSLGIQRCKAENILLYLLRAIFWVLNDVFLVKCFSARGVSERGNRTRSSRILISAHKPNSNFIFDVLGYKKKSFYEFGCIGNPIVNS